MDTLSRRLLIDILLKWQEGKLTPQEVQEFAESFTDVQEFPVLPQHDDGSIELEVLMHLDALTMLPVTRHDIPALLQFLCTPAGEAASGWATWIAYWAGRNESARKAEVADDPFYAV